MPVSDLFNPDVEPSVNDDLRADTELQEVQPLNSELPSIDKSVLVDSPPRDAEESSDTSSVPEPQRAAPAPTVHVPPRPRFVRPRMIQDATREDKLKRKALLMKIEGLLMDELLGKYVLEYSLEEAYQIEDLIDLEEYYDNILHDVNTRRRKTDIEGYALMGLSALERISNKVVGVQSQGFAASMMTDSKFREALREFDIVHTDMTYQRPEMSMATQAIMQLFSVHNMNKQHQTRVVKGLGLDTPAPKNLQDKYKDL